MPSNYVKRKRKRTKRTIAYHGRRGKPVVHTAQNGKKYIMVRKPGGGVKRLYSGSWYTENGTRKRLRL